MVKIGFSTTNMLLSRLIRKITGAKVSHCWFVFEAYGKEFVLQADVGGVKITPMGSWISKWTIVQIVSPKVDVDLAPAWDMLSESYDYGGLIGNFWVYVGRWLHKKWKNPLDSGHALFCSEFIVKVLQEAKYPGAEKFDAAATSPEDLVEFLST